MLVFLRFWEVFDVRFGFLVKNCVYFTSGTPQKNTKKICKNIYNIYIYIYTQKIDNSDNYCWKWSQAMYNYSLFFIAWLFPAEFFGLFFFFRILTPGASWRPKADRFWGWSGMLKIQIKPFGGGGGSFLNNFGGFSQNFEKMKIQKPKIEKY